jgi:L-cysteine desulfidase
MDIYKELITHEVFPALGCTEPIAVAYAAALAAAQLQGEVEEVRIEVDPGVFKNGFAVTVPNTGGEKGNLIAGALGALKVVSSTESAIRAAYMALHSHGITEEEGFVGRSAEATIKNMSRIGEIGMSLVDETMLGIMGDKKRSSC